MSDKMKNIFKGYERIFLLVGIVAIVTVLGVLIYRSKIKIPFIKKEELGLQTVPTRALHIAKNPTHPKINQCHGRGCEISPDPWIKLKKMSVERDKDRVEAQDQERTSRRFRWTQRPIGGGIFKKLLTGEKECDTCDTKDELDTQLSNGSDFIIPYTKIMDKNVFMKEVSRDLKKIAPVGGQGPLYGQVIGKKIDGKPIRHAYPGSP
jgi:hypothetical protein